MDEIFVREFNIEKVDWDIGEGIDSVDAIKNAVKIVRVEILKNRYNIVFVLDEDEWVLTKNTKYDSWSLMPAVEARPAEMDYSSN